MKYWFIAEVGYQKVIPTKSLNLQIILLFLNCVPWNLKHEILLAAISLKKLIRLNQVISCRSYVWDKRVKMTLTEESRKLH